jgi:hypothetical protein
MDCVCAYSCWVCLDICVFFMSYGDERLKDRDVEERVEECNRRVS